MDGPCEPLTSTGGLPQMVGRARGVFLEGRTLDVEWRRTQLKQLQKMYQEHRQDFFDALTKDLRKVDANQAEIKKTKTKQNKYILF